VKFSSADLGHYEVNLTFEVVGFNKQFILPCMGTASVPTINNDPRNVFMRRTKNRLSNNALPISKKYLMQENIFEYGPLLLGKDSATILAAPLDSDTYKAAFATNGERTRMTNNGQFPAVLALAVEKKAGPFFVEPKELLLEVRRVE